MTAIPLLADHPIAFPNPAFALEEPDGLVAAGGALTVEWLLEAYTHGLFPWFDSDDEHILWWSPSQRAVLLPGTMRTSKSLTKRIRNAGFKLTMDTAFAAVTQACSEPRGASEGTWITKNMQLAYQQLHEAGYAHSVEVWLEDDLVGGLYGVAIGQIFCGESMFSRVNDASKVAFHALQAQLHTWSFRLIDCQLMNPHLQSLGVTPMPRATFLKLLADNRHANPQLLNFHSAPIEDTHYSAQIEAGGVEDTHSVRDVGDTHSLRADTDVEDTQYSGIVKELGAALRGTWRFD